jgi:hypothetical protein
VTSTATITATPTITATFTPSPICAATPRGDCAIPALSQGAKLKLRNFSPDTGDGLQWRWSKGNAQKSDFGNPVQTTDYAFCLYDRVGGVASLVQTAIVAGGEMCGANPCWKLQSRGFKYANPNPAEGGLQSVLLKEGQGGRAKLQIKAKGDILALPTPVSMTQFLSQDSSITAQLVNSDGFCWGATFTAPAQRNRPDLFKDKSD